MSMRLTGRTLLAPLTFLTFLVSISGCQNLPSHQELAVSESHPRKVTDSQTADYQLKAEAMPAARTFKWQASQKRPTQDLQKLQLLETRVLELSQRLPTAVVALSSDGTRGSGILIDHPGYQGLIFTAAHIASQLGMQVRVHYAIQGRQVVTRARVICADPRRDIAILKLSETLPLKGARLIDKRQNQVTLSDWVLAYGFPGQNQDHDQPVLRLGQIHTLDASRYESSATLIGGDSGGGLFNLQGELIAIHSRIRRDLNGNIHIPVQAYTNLLKKAGWVDQPRKAAAMVHLGY